jgi:hypothetical protein
MDNGDNAMQRAQAFYSFIDLNMGELRFKIVSIQVVPPWVEQM